VKKIGILYHPMIEATRLKAEEIKGVLDTRGFLTWLCSAWETKEAKAKLDDTSLILTVGGDGTILRAAQVAVARATPITGINLGKLGFMTELRADEAIEKLAVLLTDEGWNDERAMLEVECSTQGQEPATYHALNDVVVARGAIARAISLETSIDDQHLTTYRADGVILATATGSTGYTLAAGGPILYPQCRDFLLLPIVPHLSMNYPLVLSQSAVVKLNVKTAHEATLSIDGHINLPLHNGAKVTIKLSPKTTRFWRIQPQSSFYGSMEERLKGKNWREPSRKSQD